MTDFYVLLGVARSANASEIRRAYIENAQRLHPDQNPSAKPDAMQQLNAAYEVLGCPINRRRYDLTLPANPTSNGSARTKGESYMQELTLANENELRPTRRDTNRADLTDIPMSISPQSHHQLGILVDDGSGSMASPALNGMPKRDCVGMAVGDIFTRFQGSTKRSNFSFALVDFDDIAQIRLEQTPAASLDPYQDFTPQGPGSGGTSIAAGLEKAQTLVDAFLNNGENEVGKSVVIVVLTDGMDGSAERTLQIASQLKTSSKITLCACYLAERGGSNPQAEAHLRSIASDPVKHYRTVYDAETIRGFFYNSLSAAAKL